MIAVLSYVGVAAYIREDFSNREQGQISRVAVLNITIVTNLRKLELVSSFVASIFMVLEFECRVGVLLSVV